MPARITIFSIMFGFAVKFTTSLLVFAAFFAIACSGQSEEQALKSLREMTRDGKLPPENAVVEIENRFANKRSGALAKLLHARIRFESGDLGGAASILNSDVFKRHTKVADQALWLRGRALQQSGNNGEAMKVLAELLHDYPDSIHAREAKLLWANAAIAGGRAVEVPPMLVELSEKNDAEALLTTAKAYEAQGSQAEATKYYRRTYFAGFGSAAAGEGAKKLVATDPTLQPQSVDERTWYANALFAAKRYGEAGTAYRDLATVSPSTMTPALRLKQIVALANSGKVTEAQMIFGMLPASAPEREQAYRELILGYARARLWQQARSTAEEMRQKFPTSPLVVKTFLDAGLSAREVKNRVDETYFLTTALASYPNAVEVAQVQFEAAWTEHENNNFAKSSQMFVDHLARYVDKDTTNRGKAGYWAARDSERAGKKADACALYEGVNYRYGSNWYGYLAQGRLSALRAAGNCSSTAPANDTIARAVANLRTVTVAPERAGQKELDRAARADELSTVGLFDWAIDELNEARKTAPTSPKINLALAHHYQMKGDNTNALLSLAKSYPDYAQMFPEEMGKEEWAVFYPLNYWSDIQKWAAARGLDRYQVAGFIRQETVFDPRAKSRANAYGLMQLLLPTARTVARSYGASMMPNSAEDLFQPSLNIELGTAFLKDQFTKYGRVEFVAVAYNAGPNRVPQWRSTLPAEMDDFVEAIPFKETKGYVQGIIRNSAQYRRLYDEAGNFRSNVGTRPIRAAIDTKDRDELRAEFPDLVVDNPTGGE